MIELNLFSDDIDTLYSYIISLRLEMFIEVSTMH